MWIRTGNLVLANPIVEQAAEVQIALMLTNGRDHRVLEPFKIPQGVQDSALQIELEDEAGIHLREQPLVRRNAIDHPAAEVRHLQRQIERRSPHPDHGTPEIAVRGAVDVVGKAGQVLELL